MSLERALGALPTPAIDIAPIEPLLRRIEEHFHPVEVWLFGSRARGDANDESDWDLFVVVPDDTTDDLLDPVVAWRLKRISGVRGDVIPCRASDFNHARDTVNTLSYVVANEGRRIHGR